MSHRVPQPERTAGPIPGERFDDDRRTALALVPVSRETEERLAVYIDLLRRWQTVKNLVGPATLDVIWTRHIADSAQLVSLAPQARRWVDLGSGAGFPGLVVALLLTGREGAHVDLIESNGRKCAFLRAVVRETGAPAQVHMGRIEAVLPGLQSGVDVVTSRALAPLPDLLTMSGTLLDGGALGLFMTGDDAIGALSQLSDPDRVRLEEFSLESVASRTHVSGRVVLVRKRGTAPEG